MTESVLAFGRANDHIAPARVAEQTDDCLMERVRFAGDRIAFSEIVARYRGKLTALARRSMPGANLNDAEDLVQDVFVEAYTRRKTFHAGAALRPWLYRIGLNRCTDAARRRKRHPTTAMVDENSASQPSVGSALDQLLGDERIAMINRAVDNLPDRYRFVIVLRHLDDLSYDEIGSIMGIPLASVKTHLFRARAMLREGLSTLSNE